MLGSYLSSLTGDVKSEALLFHAVALFHFNDQNLGSATKYMSLSTTPPSIYVFGESENERNILFSIVALKNPSDFQLELLRWKHSYYNIQICFP